MRIHVNLCKIGLDVLSDFVLEIVVYFPPIFLDKLVVKDDQEWCMDVFDQFVLAGQSVTLGEAVVRKYRPVSAENSHIVLHIFSSDRDDCKVNLSL